ncbi:MAG: hypothetical protein LH475_04085 [Cryobacterium sp.]|uniref:hypothetical protein n=1 Tax=Cryobacterium sp. TaxID=1926290 RepID=UPI0018C9FE52|nr:MULTISPECIES: hypothetical protein [unclassified Cryobacterium]MCY7403798.1 hypothetical protein [Cryobacterium sp.]MEC5154200.1 hypothetical protein [Cryobacterium sp. CAN_C3]
MRLRIFTAPQQGAGFDAFLRSDHYQVVGEGDGLPGPTDVWWHTIVSPLGSFRS